MLQVAITEEQVEAALAAGTLACPACSGPLSPWGFARSRELRLRSGTRELTPRRARCGGCARTHVVCPAFSVPRRRDSAAAARSLAAGLVGPAARPGTGHARVGRIARRGPRRCPDNVSRALNHADGERSTAGSEAVSTRDAPTRRPDSAALHRKPLTFRPGRRPGVTSSFVPHPSMPMMSGICVPELSGAQQQPNRHPAGPDRSSLVQEGRHGLPAEWRSAYSSPSTLGPPTRRDRCILTSHDGGEPQCLLRQLTGSCSTSAQDLGGRQQDSPGHRGLAAFASQQIVQIDSLIEHGVEISTVHQHDR
jgi:Domain of unknown function (DUF6431)